MTTPPLPPRTSSTSAPESPSASGCLGFFGTIVVEIVLGHWFGRLADRAPLQSILIALGMLAVGVISGLLGCALGTKRPLWQCMLPAILISFLAAAVTMTIGGLLAWTVTATPSPIPPTPLLPTPSASATAEPTATATPLPTPTLTQPPAPFCPYALPLRTPSGQATYRVVAGDTTTAIAERFGVSVEALIAANVTTYPEMVNANCLRVDWVLVIPPAEQSP